MADYTFESLNDKEFEHLVRDLLQKEMEVTFENFKAGQDQGIDLRYSKSQENHIIIQCKHWLKSGIPKLKSHFKSSEFGKVKKLKPQRYIIATSLGLSPVDKKEIKDIFEPFILKESDIIGKETLNNLLTKYPEVEENHFKLWLSSTNILKRITNEYIRERSRLYAEEIKDRIKLFVPTINFQTAEEILEKHRVLMITGEPGIGKTMLGDFLIFKYLKDDFELTYIHKSLTDAEEVFESEKKQIFYFDDFLGSNYLEILSEKKFDSQLFHLIRGIRRSKNHRLILTSRTTIYNVAKYKSEILDDESFNILNYKLELSEYSYRDRAKILYNHLFFSQLDDKYVNQITENGFYFKIIKHENFNPRIIEFITDETKISLTNPEDYSSFILNALNNPSTIWLKAFHHQISDIDRIFLLTLFSFDLPVEEEKFKEAFDARLAYETKEHGYKKPINYYNKSIETLLGGFIKRYDQPYYPSKKFFLEFINPSVVDFFINYLKDRKNETLRIIKSARFYEQIETRFISRDSDLTELFDFEEINEEIFDKIKDLNHVSLPNSIQRLIYIYSFDTIKPHLDKLIPFLLDTGFYGNSTSISLLNECYEIPSVKNLVDSNLEDYITYLRNSIENMNDLELFNEFLSKTDIDMLSYLDEYSPDIITQLEVYITERLEEVDLSNIKPPYYERPGYREDFKHKLNRALDHELEYIESELFDLGLDTSTLQELELKPDLKDLANRFEKELKDSHTELHRPKHSSSSPFKYSDRKFIKDLFS